MKLKNVFKSGKKMFPENIILIKSGVFVYTYGIDAILINKLMDYKIINERLGFPVAALFKVIVYPK